MEKQEQTMERETGSNAKLLDLLVEGLVVGGYVSAIAVNGLVQQVKHGYYHLSGVEHERVPNDERPDAYFDVGSHYMKR